MLIKKTAFKAVFFDINNLFRNQILREFVKCFHHFIVAFFKCINDPRVEMCTTFRNYIVIDFFRRPRLFVTSAAYQCIKNICNRNNSTNFVYLITFHTKITRTVPSFVVLKCNNSCKFHCISGSFAENFFAFL